MKTMTQTEAVIKMFKSKKWITPIKAFEITGTMRLAAVISRLKDRGYKFETKRVKFKTRYGTTGVYSAYKLV